MLTDQDFFQTVAEICKRQTWILAMWVFGSYAKGTARLNSDIDIAVLAENSTSDLPLLTLITGLEKAFGRHVDVVLPVR